FALDATLIGYNGSDEIELDMDFSRVTSSLEAWIVPAEMICEPDPGTPISALDVALNVEGGTLHFETEETYPWIVLEDEERMWAQSGNAGVHNSTSTLTLTVTVEEGQMLTFEYKAWGEGSSDSYDWDKCRFYVDGEIQFDYGAHQNDWLDYTTSALTAGEHVFTWTYKKDGSTNPTGDYFAVDNVELLAAGTPIEEHIIHEIVIDGFTVPEWNANPDYVVTVPEDAPYSVGYCDWNWYYEDDYEDGDILPENGVFDDEEKLYYMYISINPDSGWTVAEDVVITINGETGYVVNSGYVASSNLVWIYTINFTVTEPTEPGDIAIHEVWVDGFGTPVAGVAGIDHMFLTTPDDAPYFIVYGGWRDETDQQQMWSEEHVFIPGHYYSEGCQIWAEEGYYFAEDCVFYVNGGTELVDEQWSYVDEADNWICYVNILPVECFGTPMLLGDVDLDGEVTVSDALLAMRYAMGLVELTEQQLDQLDVNFDGEYDLVDATLILRYAMGLIEEFPLPVGV
ncbi:MAG: dockerin type I repeat-containing protein, partial [Clostridia bacterium]|nr:dockerin type I repeat-containing protein [Clostridia bacterium]